MSSKDRRPYLTASVLNQALLDACHDNLECRLEMIVEIETPIGTIYASDRNKYVGGTFYEALLNFPVISRTVGEWLSTELQFSTLTFELSNVDGRFNNFLPAGADFGGWIGKDVIVKLGLAEQSSTYFQVFTGKITDVGGFKRTTKSIVVIARDNYDRMNATFPTATMTETAYPKIEPKNVGKIIPVIYGDWTVATEPAPASVPAFVVNGNDPEVTRKEKTVTITGPASPAVFTCPSHSFDINDPVELLTTGTLPAPFAPATTYYIKTVSLDQFTLSAILGGPAIASTTSGSGDHRVKCAASALYQPIELLISVNDNSLFGEVYLQRGQDYYAVPSSEVTVGAGNKSLTVAHNTATLWVEGAAYIYESGDLFWVTCKGKDLGVYDDNLVTQASDILMTYGGVFIADFDSSWWTYRDKASPAQSAVSVIKSRAWIGESTPALTYVLSMLEQVRLETFVNRDLRLEVNSLHFEDWVSSPSYSLRNWDVVRDSFQTTIDERNNFNTAQGVFNFLPDVGQNAWATPILTNTSAVTQAGKRIAKKLVFPNLYVLEDVKNQVVEILRLSSSTLEVVNTSLTWRSVIKDIGDFMSLNVQIGSAIFSGVPCMVREIGYDPQGLKVVAKLWSLAMTPFPGYTPGYAGTVGGYSATITEET